MSKVSFDRVLVVTAHVDDMEYGCCGAVCRLLREGAEVHLLALSDCEDSNIAIQHEAMQSAKFLGVFITVMAFPVRKFPEHRQEILEEIRCYVRNYNPDLVITHGSFDRHQDHEVVHKETWRAAKDRTIWGFNQPWNCTATDHRLKFTLDIKDCHRTNEARSMLKSTREKPYHRTVHYGEDMEVIRWVC